MKKVSNQKGFSLIELMVVVAIIGILATVADPQVNKFMAKARQSEAKTNLGTLFTTEKALFAEYNTHYGSFSVLGYGPQGALKYNIGFDTLGAVTAANLTAAGYPVAAPNATLFNAAVWCPAALPAGGGGSCTFNPAAIAIPAAADVQQATFLAIAIGNVDSDTNQDEWRIDHLKVVTNFQPDVN
jgi:type IV pilus assembly protein PilA